jgi:hypothetical protein
VRPSGSPSVRATGEPSPHPHIEARGIERWSLRQIQPDDLSALGREPGPHHRRAPEPTSKICRMAITPRGFAPAASRTSGPRRRWHNRGTRRVRPGRRLLRRPTNADWLESAPRTCAPSDGSMPDPVPEYRSGDVLPQRVGHLPSSERGRAEVDQRPTCHSDRTHNAGLMWSIREAMGVVSSVNLACNSGAAEEHPKGDLSARRPLWMAPPFLG